MQENLFISDSSTLNVTIDMEGEKFKFIICTEDQPIVVAFDTDKAYLFSFPINYPLFSTILHLKEIYDAKFSTLDSVIEPLSHQFDDLLDKALLTFKKNNQIIIKSKEEAQLFIEFLELTRELFNATMIKWERSIRQLASESPNSEALYNEFKDRMIEKLILKFTVSLSSFVLDFKKILVIDHKIQKLNKAINNYLSDQLTSIATFYFDLGYFHQAEIYLKNAIVFAEKVTDQKHLQQINFGLKLILAQVYFKFGYFESTLSLIQQIQGLANKKKYQSDFYYLLIGLLDFLRGEVIPFYHDKSALVTLEICQNTIMLINNVLSQIKGKEDPKACQRIAVYCDHIKTAFSQAQGKYLAELTNIMKSSLGIKKIVMKIQHDFSQGCLLITTKTQKHRLILSGTLRKFGIQPIIISEQIKVDLYRCNPKLVAKICDKSLEIFEQEAQLAKLNEETKLKLTNAQLLNLGYEKSQFISEPTISKKSSTSGVFSKAILTDLTTHVVQKRNKLSTPSSKKIENPSLKEADQGELIKEDYIIHWSKTGLSYDSKKENQGVVKMLSGEDNFTLNGMYFAYLPDYIFDDEHYHPGFADRLTRGKIQKQCIRWITKEMQNLGKSECFLFKIVISRRDPRMYLWIEDIFIDAEGKQRFLLCAGLISNHKLKKLPKNPQKLKDKLMQKHRQIKAISQEVAQESTERKFFDSFIEILYDEKTAIPNQIKTSLQTFLNDFIHSIYPATKKLNQTQYMMLFSQLLEMNSLLLKLVTQNLTMQLEITQEILKILSVLESQGVYGYIVTPLLMIMKQMEDHYVIEIKALAFNDIENFSDDTAAKQILSQLTQSSVQAEIALSDFEKIESVTELQQKESAVFANAFK